MRRARSPNVIGVASKQQPWSPGGETRWSTGRQAGHLLAQQQGTLLVVARTLARAAVDRRLGAVGSFVAPRRSLDSTNSRLDPGHSGIEGKESKREAGHTRAEGEI